MDSCDAPWWFVFLAVFIANIAYSYLKAFVIAAWDDLDSHRSRKRVQKERKRKEVPGCRPPPPPSPPRRRRKSER